MAESTGGALASKLGVGQGQRLAVLNAPQAVLKRLHALPQGARLLESLRGRGPFDMILLFVRSKDELARRFLGVSLRLTPEGGLWILWPDGGSRKPCDLDAESVRELAAQHGMVAREQSAIITNWSGLRCDSALR